MTASSLTAAMFSTAGMQQVFSDQNTVQCMLDFEAALAAAEAREEVIPQQAVAAIAACCNAARIDLNALAHSAGQAGNLAIPLVKQLTQHVALVDAEAAKFVHWGATSQDVIDTGMVLQLRQAFDLISIELAELADTLAMLALRHRATPLMGRTWMQHALRLPSASKRRAGWMGCYGIRNALRKCARACSCCSSAAQQARWQALVTAA